MITVSIRFKSNVTEWLVDCSHYNRTSVSEFIRELLYEKMRLDDLKFNRVKLNQNQPITPNYRSRLGSVVFTAKLLERFVITTEDNGEEMRDQAFQETNELLEMLNFSNSKNKDRQLCISLDQQLYSWLKLEVIRLQVRAASLIRNVVENAFVYAITKSDDTVSSAQKIGMEYQLITCKLLERFITEIVEDGFTIIEEVRTSTNEYLARSYPEKQTYAG